MSTSTLPESTHPAPERHKARLATLLVGLSAGPLAWSAQSIIGYSLSSYACFPDDTPRYVPLFAHLESTLVTLNIAAIVVCAVAALLAYRSWSATRGERGGPSEELLEVGEGRTRFLAMCGVLVSAGFIVATLFTSFALAFAPVCR